MRYSQIVRMTGRVYLEHATCVNNDVVASTVSGYEQMVDRWATGAACIFQM
jgi:hypothetical protein